jgi:hypothetical protein
MKPKFDVPTIEIPMKKCQTWNPLPTNKITGTLWESLSYDDMKLDICEFVDYFASKPVEES